MEYIDKTNPDIKKKAHKLLKDFIDGQWQKDASRYINLAYEHYDISKLRPLLLNEQNHLCSFSNNGRSLLMS